LFDNFTYLRGKEIPLQVWRIPEGSKSLKLSNFKRFGTRRWRFSALSAICLYLAGNITGTHLC